MDHNKSSGGDIFGAGASQAFNLVTVADAVALQAENQRLRIQLDILLHEARLNQAKMARFDLLERKVIGATSLAALVKILLVDYKEVFELDAVSLALLDPSYEVARILIDQSPTGTADEGLVFPEDNQPFESLYLPEAQPILSRFESAHAFLFEDNSAGLASVALLPLMHHGQLIGSLNLGSKNAERFVAGDGTDFLERQAALLAVCLENALVTERLKVVGLTDILTGLYNRRYFESRCLEEVLTACRHGAPLVCLFLDLDRFKHLNDTLGHQAGDDALRRVAKLIKAQLRGSDVVARYGGEEFVVLLPATSHQAGLETAERIRRVVADQSVSLKTHETVHMTLSIGVAMLEIAPTAADASMLVAEMIARADKALYAAKAAGRNRVVSASEL